MANFQTKEFTIGWGGILQPSFLVEKNNKMTSEPIYRDYHCRLSKDACAELLQAIAICKASIISTFTLGNGFPEKTVNRWEMFFKLKFRNQESLDKFHSLGLETTEPEVIKLNLS